MDWYALDTWIVITGALCAVACVLPGTFLVLRNMSMMGDAISHAVLPGLAIAFLVTGSRSSIWMFTGAALVGLLTALATQWISQWGKVDRNASMGIVFTTLFALGLLIIVQAADHVDLDPNCVLYGALELTPLDVVAEWTLFGVLIELPRAALVLAIVTIINLALLLIFYKEMKIAAFDPALAESLGLRAGRMHYLLMVQVAVTTVAAFEAVGSIIVVAMLIVPPATALLLTKRLGTVLLLSALLGIAAAVIGHLGAIYIPPLLGYNGTSTAGMMALATGILFLLAWVRHLSQRSGD
jgi:manganese/zinc/iron transport system permease protein